MVVKLQGWLLLSRIIGKFTSWVNLTSLSYFVAWCLQNNDIRWIPLDSVNAVIRLNFSSHTTLLFANILSWVNFAKCNNDSHNAGMMENSLILHIIHASLKNSALKLIYKQLIGYCIEAFENNYPVEFSFELLYYRF